MTRTTRRQYERLAELDTLYWVASCIMHSNSPFHYIIFDQTVMEEVFNISYLLGLKYILESLSLL